MTITRRNVRAVLVDELGRFVFIKRSKPDSPPYWVTVGGGVEQDDTSLSAALRREVFEETGGTVIDSHLVFLHQVTNPQGTTLQYIFLAKVRGIDTRRRTGGEFSKPERGGYDVESVAPTAAALGDINLLPGELKAYLMSTIDALVDISNGYPV